MPSRSTLERVVRLELNIGAINNLLAEEKMPRRSMPSGNVQTSLYVRRAKRQLLLSV